MVSQTTTIASISNGHAFRKHVIENGEFQNVNVKTPEDLARHIQDTINHPDTIGAATYDANGRVKNGGV